MEKLTKVILKDKEITDRTLLDLIWECMGETGGIQHVGRNLTEIGYPNFNHRAYAEIDKAEQTHHFDFSDLSSNEFLVICIVIFATVKEVEQDILIATPFDEGIQLLRGI
jgi:hypothetical protein